MAETRAGGGSAAEADAQLLERPSSFEDSFFGVDRSPRMTLESNFVTTPGEFELRVVEQEAARLVERDARISARISELEQRVVDLTEHRDQLWHRRDQLLVERDAKNARLAHLDEALAAERAAAQHATRELEKLRAFVAARDVDTADLVPAKRLVDECATRDARIAELEGQLHGVEMLLEDERGRFALERGALLEASRGADRYVRAELARLRATPRVMVQDVDEL